MIELLYTGTKGTHLDLMSDPNEAAPGRPLGSDQRRRIPTASDFTYDILRRRFDLQRFPSPARRGECPTAFAVLFLYTLGHAIDDASAIGVWNNQPRWCEQLR